MSLGVLFAIGMLGSIVVFAISVLLFRAPTLVRRGDVDVRSVYSSHDAKEVNYGARFKTPPRLHLRASGYLTYHIVNETTSGFALRVSSLGSDAALKWEADGVPAEGCDPRSPVERLHPIAKISLITGGLTALGFVADLVGIFGFLVAQSSD